MPRHIDPDELEAIVKILKQHPDGATVEQVARLVDTSRRTLQRRLAELVADGRVRASALGRNVVTISPRAVMAMR